MVLVPPLLVPSKLTHALAALTALTDGELKDVHVVAGNVALLSLRARLSPVKLNAPAVRLCVLKDPTANVVSPPSYKAAVRVCISVYWW